MSELIFWSLIKPHFCIDYVKLKILNLVRNVLHLQHTELFYFIVSQSFTCFFLSVVLFMITLMPTAS